MMETQEESTSSPRDSIVSPVKSAPKRVLADGTYATESALSVAGRKASSTIEHGQSKPPLRGIYFIFWFVEGFFEKHCCWEVIISWEVFWLLR